MRLYWSIENSLHWVLGVVFSEDPSRKRIGNTARKFSTLSKIALNLLKMKKQESKKLKERHLRVLAIKNICLKCEFSLTLILNQFLAIF